MKRPQNIQENHYGEQDLASKRLRWPAGYNTGHWVYLSALWRPNVKTPQFQVKEIENGVGNGTCRVFRTRKEAETFFNTYTHIE